jgi:hypothetical protein
MARQIMIMELICVPVFKRSGFFANAAGLVIGAAPWKIAPVTRATTTGKSELTAPKAKPKASPRTNRHL